MRFNPLKLNFKGETKRKKLSDFYVVFIQTNFELLGGK